MDEAPQISPYRVFISYSHDDLKIAETVAAHLTNNLKATTLWDPELSPGVTFSDELREMIAFAHVFLTILTPNSNSRPWVHQEIGYAIALGIPVLPLAIGDLPLGMADRLQALRLVEGKGPFPLAEIGRALESKFKIEHLEDAVARCQGARTSIPVLCAPQPEDRTLMLIEHLLTVVGRNRHKDADSKAVRPETNLKVLHEASFGTFSLPDAPASAGVWACRDGYYPRSVWLRSHFRRERHWTEHLAKTGGCDLIIHPDDDERRLGDAVRRQCKACSLYTRRKQLRDFIDGIDEQTCRVVVSKEPFKGNILIVGDWFVAQTLSPSHGHGFEQTIITRHAPSVSERAKQFEADFEALLKKEGIGPGECKERALKALDDLLPGSTKGRVEPPPCLRTPKETCPLELRSGRPKRAQPADGTKTNT